MYCPSNLIKRSFGLYIKFNKISDLNYNSLLKIAQLLEFNKTTLNLIKLPIIDLLVKNSSNSIKLILTNIKGPIFFDFKNFKLSSHLQKKIYKYITFVSF